MSTAPSESHPKRAPGAPAPTTEDVASLSETFSGLSDPTRLRIIYSILHTERSVGDIAAHLDLSEPSVSQHLRRLRHLRMVRMRRDGRHRYYTLDDDHVSTLLSVCLEHVQGG